MPYPNDMALTRAQLHHLVWQKPLKATAKELGITCRRLTELCRKLEVPYPTAHYWKRKSAGLKVVDLGLPKALKPELESVSLATTEEEVLCLSAPIDPKRLIVPKKLSRPHRVVKEWCIVRKRLQDAHPNNRTALAWSESERRQHRILDTIFKSAQSYGFFVRSGETVGTFIFQYKRAEIPCRLRQKKTRVQVVNRVSGAAYYEGRLSPNLLFAIESSSMLISKYDVSGVIPKPRSWRT